MSLQNSKELDTCMICFDEDNIVNKLKCGHQFCYYCILRDYKSSNSFFFKPLLPDLAGIIPKILHELVRNQLVQLMENIYLNDDNYQQHLQDLLIKVT